MQFNTNQWIVLNYPVGAGGKFLTACLLQFNKVAHWSGRAMPAEDTINWYAQSLPGDINAAWSVKEIDTPWVIPVSRQWPRGENLSAQEFNLQLINTSGNYFRQAWQDEKYIVDFWHKSKRPDWWTNAQWFGIVVDDMVMYKKLLFGKLFQYDADKKIMISNDQKPGIGRPEHQLKKDIFKNQWMWENVSSTEEFFEQHITKMPWYTSWNFDEKLSENYILLSELFDADKVYKFLCRHQDVFGQTVDKNYVHAIHNLWYNSTMAKINKLS